MFLVCLLLWINVNVSYSIHSFLIRCQIFDCSSVFLFICAFPLRATEYGLERSWWCVVLSGDERTVCSSGERSVFTHDRDNIITGAQTFTEELLCTLTKFLSSFLLLSHIYPTFSFLLSAHASFTVLLKLPTSFHHFYPKLKWVVYLSD